MFISKFIIQCGFKIGMPLTFLHKRSGIPLQTEVEHIVPLKLLAK